MRGYTDQNNEELFVVMNLELNRWVLVHGIIWKATSLSYEQD